MSSMFWLQWLAVLKDITVSIQVLFIKLIFWLKKEICKKLLSLAQELLRPMIMPQSVACVT